MSVNNHKNIKILVSHRTDIDSRIIDNDIFLNLRCGAIFDKRENIEMLGDDTGENISFKKENYSELTVLYWGWKNIDADYYGLCHYRRYFSFSKKKHKTDYENLYVRMPSMSDKNIRELKLEDSISRQIIENNDIILTQPYNFKRLGYKTVYDQYSQHTTVKDLQLMLDILDEFYPEYKESAHEYIYGYTFFPCLMCIMRKEIHNEYCKWLFTIIFEMEKRLTIKNPSQDKKRTIGYVAERMLGIFYTHYMKKHPHTKVQVLQRVLFENTEHHSQIKIANTPNTLNLVMAISSSYVPYAKSTLTSIASHLNTHTIYNVIILTGDLTEQEKLSFHDMYTNSNICIQIYNILSYMDNYKDKLLTHEEIFMLIPLIFPTAKNIIYLHSDLIFLEDIKKLLNYSIDKDNIWWTAAIDLFVSGEYNRDLIKTKDYLSEKLKMKDPTMYRNLGVSIIYPNKFPMEYKEIIKTHLEDKKSGFNNSDFINKLIEDHVSLLPQEWNYVPKNKFFMDLYGLYAPLKTYNNYIEAAKKPKIIHYSGTKKPWNFITYKDDFFWDNIRNRSFYEEIIFRAMATNNKVKSQKKIFIVIKNLIKKPVLLILNTLFPHGSIRREKLKKYYYQLIND